MLRVLLITVAMGIRIEGSLTRRRYGVGERISFMLPANMQKATSET